MWEDLKAKFWEGCAAATAAPAVGWRLEHGSTVCFSPGAAAPLPLLAEPGKSQCAAFFISAFPLHFNLPKSVTLVPGCASSASEPSCGNKQKNPSNSPKPSRSWTLTSFQHCTEVVPCPTRVTSRQRPFPELWCEENTPFHLQVETQVPADFAGAPCLIAYAAAFS